MLFFFNDTATTEIYTLSLHDALPICRDVDRGRLAVGAGRERQLAPVGADRHRERLALVHRDVVEADDEAGADHLRSEEHTSELQSRQYLVCRLLLEKKNSLTAQTSIA